MVTTDLLRNYPLLLATPGIVYQWITPKLLKSLQTSSIQRILRCPHRLLFSIFAYPLRNSLLSFFSRDTSFLCRFNKGNNVGYSSATIQLPNLILFSTYNLYMRYCAIYPVDNTFQTLWDDAHRIFENPRSCSICNNRTHHCVKSYFCGFWKHINILYKKSEVLLPFMTYYTKPK